MTTRRLTAEEVDELGPYSPRDLQEIADANGIRCVVLPAADAYQRSSLLADYIESGGGVVLLWLANRFGGHFVTLFRRGSPGREVVELFDPLGSPGGSLGRYTFDDPQPGEAAPLALNGRPGWVARLLRTLEGRGLRPTYNPEGPQHPTADSCGIHCLIRLQRRGPSPERFRVGRPRVILTARRS